MIRNPRWARKWSSQTVIRVATFGSLGSLKAPGTWGSAAGVLLYVAIFHQVGLGAQIVLALAACYFAIGVCGEAEKRLKKEDPGEVVIDEVAAMPICYFGVQPYFGYGNTWWILLAGFVLFRFFDILKPLGIKQLQRYHGGFGVVVDDVAAAIATAVVMNVGIRIIL